jgi:hypothetical protein
MASITVPPELLPIFTQTRCRVKHAVFANAATGDPPGPRIKENNYFVAVSPTSPILDGVNTIIHAILVEEVLSERQG